MGFLSKVGKSLGKFASSAGGGMLASAGLDILGDAFSDNKGPSLGKQYRENIKYAGAHLPNYVAQAKKAGLHPLFAMGASGGGSPQFAIPGQTGEGSFAAKGLKTAGQAMGKYAQLNAQKELVEAQNQASALRIAENRMSNDTSQAVAKTAMGNITHGYADYMTIDELEKRYGEIADLEGAVRYVADAFRSTDTYRTSQTPAAKNKLATHRARAQGILRKLDQQIVTLPKNIRDKVKSLKIQASRHPGAYRKRGYAGPQPYKQRGWK